MRSSRKERVRKVLKSRSDRPRLSVFVSNQHIYAQIIDDKKGQTLVSVSDLKVEAQGRTIEIAEKVGEILAQEALGKKIKSVKFDRGAKRYHGRIKALADGARKKGLNF